MTDASRISVEDLQAIRLRDSVVKVYVDKYGGRYVLRADGRTHGQHAIMDRRLLLEYLDDLSSCTAAVARDSGWVIEAQAECMYLFIPPGASLQSSWTPLSREGIRFARQEDARDFMRTTSALSNIRFRPQFFTWVTTPC